MMTSVLDELQWRGLAQNFTAGVPELLTRERVTLYNGFDPSADSLQVGNLVPLIGLARFQRFGHTPIALAGGGTGMIGDPGGKTHERPLLSAEQVQANVEGIRAQMVRFLDFEVKSNPAQLLDNAAWLTELALVDFLRDVGKHFTVNYMIAKEAVKSRLGREEGISFTEFSYMLLQAYDFVHLWKHYGCTFQAGGTDQWGNITAGVELIRRALGKKAHALVYPLVTSADGSKLGKTAFGTVWLDPDRTSPYRFYQFWLNTDDRDAVSYLKIFTWLTKPQIDELAQALLERPEKREAQRALAREMTRMVHDETALVKAEQASRVLFGGEVAGLSAEDIKGIAADVPSDEVRKQEFEGDGMLLVDLLVTTGLASSKGDARRLIEGGGIYINNTRVGDAARNVTIGDSIEGQVLLLRKGRRNYHLVQLMG